MTSVEHQDIVLDNILTVFTHCPNTALQTQPLTPTGHPHLKKVNSEEIQDDFDWDSLIE